MSRSICRIVYKLMEFLHDKLSKKKRELYEQGNVWRLFNGLQTSAHETSVMYNETILCFCKIRFRVDFIDLHWALRVFEDRLGFMERAKKK